MTPAITFPPFPTRAPFAPPGAPEAAELERSVRAEDAHLDALEALYDRLCETADGGNDSAEVEHAARDFWDRLCELMARDQRDLARVRQWPRGRARRATLAALTRHAERLAELMRTMAVVWDELDLDTPDELAEAVWTFTVPPLAYLRAMWNLFWSSVRHPLSETTIELKTGRVFVPD